MVALKVDESDSYNHRNLGGDKLHCLVEFLSTCDLEAPATSRGALLSTDLPPSIDQCAFLCELACFGAFLTFEIVVFTLGTYGCC